MTQGYIGIKLVTAYELEKFGKAGYGVIYPDGYISWSPKETFESSYIPVDSSYQVSLDITTKKFNPLKE